ncbi:hypothetical protein AB6C42_13185 [Vibrio cyclitrophicus]
MSIKIQKLFLSSNDGEVGELVFDKKDHLVFGPTDTGKTYVVDAIKFILGGKVKYLRDIGYNNVYAYIGLQFVWDNEPYTLFRELSGMNHIACKGFLEEIDKKAKVKGGVTKFLLNIASVDNQQILRKAGVLGGITAGDMRRNSLFSETDTLSLTAFEGSDSNSIVRNRASLCCVLSGKDDQDMVLVASTEDRTLAKGKVELIEEQMLEIARFLPDDFASINIQEKISEVSDMIDKSLENTSKSKIELSENRQKYFQISKELEKADAELKFNNETSSNFELLSKKFTNDLERINSLKMFSELSSHYDVCVCPLCDNNIEPDEQELRSVSIAAEAELKKIKFHLDDVILVKKDLDSEIFKLKIKRQSIEEKLLELDSSYDNLSKKLGSQDSDFVSGLLDQRTDLLMWERSIKQYNGLEDRLEKYENASVQEVQIISRDIEESSKVLVARVKSLLEEWGVPGVEKICFNKDNVDLIINDRERVSYGKGKRGIFLTAYVISLMEIAIKEGNPHLGFVIVDSPVVTYKDPKHSKDKKTFKELLDVSVKTKFYNWLFTRQGLGQIIVLENEEPSLSQQSSSMCTEFFGPDSDEGRKGLLPS